MRKFLIAAFAVSGLILSSAAVKAEEHEKDAKGVNGVLIDAKCGMKDDKPKSEADAAKHGAGCAIKCADTGLGVTSGDKWIKFDEKGQKLAIAYLKEVEAKDNKDKADDAKDKKTTKVHVEGKVSEDGKTMEVTAIHPAKAKKEKKES
jgi:hypothetical protein